MLFLVTVSERFAGRLHAVGTAENANQVEILLTEGRKRKRQILC